MTSPFLLFDDARPGGKALLYQTPQEIVVAEAAEEVVPALERLKREKRHIAGFITYEAGYALEPRLAPLAAASGDVPMLWFGIFDRPQVVAAEAWLPSPRGSWAGAAQPLVSRADHEARVAAAIEHILDGDIYQANITFPADVPVAGGAMALYAGLRQRQRAGHGALLFTGAHWILSLSPELFFEVKEGRVTTRPMKGTAPRQRDAAADAQAAQALSCDPKQRAENLMIVDLLRNDLSRLSRPGSVEVPDLFTVETYPTVHQMTSTITGELEGGSGPIDLLRTIFPCGSVTGAPKIRAMEIIHALERQPRGIYCGSIGWVAPDGAASFNVAIRTLSWRAGAANARLGLGSGIVADSRPGDEWRECVSKGAFVKDKARFDLIETMRYDPEEGVAELDRHLARLKNSAQALGFHFDRHSARNELQAATFGANASKVRLLLARSGAIAVELRPLPQDEGPVTAALAPMPVAADDFRLRHKTTDRAFYDQARAEAGTWEVLFTDPEGFLTEGSFTNIFVERAGRLLTPPVSRGLFPGILRDTLIEQGRAVEADLRPDDLAQGLLLGNSVRGLVSARLQISSSTAA